MISSAPIVKVKSIQAVCIYVDTGISRYSSESSVEEERKNSEVIDDGKIIDCGEVDDESNEKTFCFMTEYKDSKHFSECAAKFPDNPKKVRVCLIEKINVETM